MGLILNEIKLSGFGSYGDKPQTLHFGGQGPVAIVGDNGAGKSTAVSKALTWCLYGKCAPERMGSGMRTISGKAVMNPATKKAVVAVTLANGDTTYRVTRTRTSKGSDKVEVQAVRGDEVSAMEATEATIESIVGADYFVFTRTVVRGQGDLWSFAEATDKAKRELLDVVSGAFVLESAETRATLARKRAEKRAEQASLLADQAHNRLINKNPEALRLKGIAWDEENGGRVNQAEAEHAAAKADEAKAKAEAGKATTKAAEYDALVADKPFVDMTPYTDALRDASNRKNKADKVVTLARAAYEAVSGLSFGDQCGTCGQTVSEDAPIVGQQSTAKAALAEAIEAGEEPTRFAQECQESLTGADDWAEYETEQWREAVAALGSVPRDRTSDAVRYRVLAKSKLDTLKRSTNPFTLAHDREEKEVFELAKTVSGYRAIQKAALEEATIADAWSQALGAKGARAHMAETALQAIEAEANQWLAVLSDGTLSVEFPPTREVKGSTKEDIKTVITSRACDGSMESRDLLTYSGGERRRINLAVDLGVASVFAKGGLALSLLVLDEEVFSGMDEAGKAGVVYALHGAGIADVVIIDHDPRLSSTLPRTLKVKRGKDGTSEIETA
jgi:DNA repair exonuclease SbcCD ATPase subunit